MPLGPHPNISNNIMNFPKPSKLGPRQYCSCIAFFPEKSMLCCSIVCSRKACQKGAPPSGGLGVFVQKAILLVPSSLYKKPIHYRQSKKGTNTHVCVFAFCCARFGWPGELQVHASLSYHSSSKKHIHTCKHPPGSPLGPKRLFAEPSIYVSTFWEAFLTCF